MKTEYQKMLAGELYDAGVNELAQLRIKARIWMQEYNQTVYDKAQRTALIKKLFAKTGSNADIQTPFFIDYGCHIEVGDNFFANFNCVFLDCNYIKCGNNVFLGPNVQIYTATHPIDHKVRASGLEFAKPISIGEDVWVGGSAVICPGVTIGDRSIIGAGSVVTRDIPADVFAAGNPCRVIRHLSEEDKR